MLKALNCISVLQAYDTVNRGILWKIMEKVGVPRKMSSIIRGSRDNMQARILVLHGQLSNIEVTFGLRLGCPPALSKRESGLRRITV